MRRRILHVVQEADGGGAAYAWMLARHAVSQGTEVTLVWPKPPKQRPPEQDTSGIAIGIRVQPLRTGTKMAWILRLAWTADLIHVSGARAATWSFPALLLRPSVITFHGAHPLRRRAGRVYGALAPRLVKMISRVSDAVICVADSERRDLETAGVDPHKIHVARNGVPPQPLVTKEERRIARRSLELEGDRLAVLLVARLDPPKDPLAALEIVSPLRDSAVLLVAGDGPLLREARAQAPPNARLLGYCRDVRRLLAAADVVLNTSQWEGLPLGLLEAMWAGIPIVATAVPGNVEAVGDAGLLVERGDHDAFRKAILSLRDPGLRVELRRRGRERVEREFSLQRMLELTDALYRELLPSAGK
jgi:glycosyltransferase involved in cell wall biosynthesis